MINSRWYQIEAEEALYNYFASKGGNPVIAMPTGTGKSIVIGNIVANAMRQWPNQRFMMLTHVKELIKQNAEKLLAIWPQAPLGIYSAGLAQKDCNYPIIYGGIQSVARNVEAFGKRDIIFIDEAHLVSPEADTKYSEVILKFLALNPKLKVVGFSATPYRLKQGMLTDSGIFTDICYNLTTVDAFNRLVSEGYLSPLISKKPNTELDVSKVGIVANEYNQNQLQQAVDKEKITRKALTELLSYSHNRQSGLIFATGIEHAEHINEMLTKEFNQSSVVIHSKKSDTHNEIALQNWKNGAVKWAVNMNALTTGVDNPAIDIIGVLRPTLSSVLWVQMLGRGTRPCPQSGKNNCLVLDFAGNTKRLGPINDPVIPRKKGKGTGEAPIRICDACGCYNHASARQCVNCGEEFEIKIKFKDKASTDEVMTTGFAQVEYFDVTYVIYNKHIKNSADALPSIKVSYFCGLQKFDKWVSFENPRAKHFAHEWWRQVHSSAPPETTDEALRHVSELRAPKRIRVWVNKKYPEVLGYEY